MDYIYSNLFGKRFCFTKQLQSLKAIIRSSVSNTLLNPISIYYQDEALLDLIVAYCLVAVEVRLHSRKCKNCTTILISFIAREVTKRCTLLIIGCKFCETSIPCTTHVAPIVF